jgi:hypothetical protein
MSTSTDVTKKPSDGRNNSEFADRVLEVVRENKNDNVISRELIVYKTSVV